MDLSVASALTDLAAQQPGLEMFLLVGSRARGDHRPDSDWDFAYTGTAALDSFDLMGKLNLLLKTDKVDLADLDRAGGLFRYRAAKDARVLFEQIPGSFRAFWLKAVDFWCDAQPVIRKNVDSVLGRMAK